MQDSDLRRILRFALEALMFVSKGASERGAILKVSRSDPNLASVKSQASDLILATLNEQNLLDPIVQDIIPTKNLTLRIQCMSRLVAHLLLEPGKAQTIAQLEKVIKSIVQTENLPIIQLLMGSLSAVDPKELFLNLVDSEKVALESHYPAWWVRYCFRSFGRDHAIRLLFSAPRPRYVRINPLRNRGRTTLPAQAKSLMEKMSKVSSNPSIFTTNSSPSQFSQFFSQGLLQMQDMSSFVAVKAASPLPGENVLDLCAAPGGKTSTLAQFMKNRGRIVSVDYSRERMRSWKREVSRLGVKVAEPVICDATSLSVHDHFDLIFIDAPCTGTGILDRNPSMKWHLTPESVEKYPRIQRSILESAYTSLAEEGRILYCTCSVTLEENERVISSFLRAHPEFESTPISVELGSPGLEGLTDCVRLWPYRDRTAGYFIARLQHVS